MHTYGKRVIGASLLAFGLFAWAGCSRDNSARTPPEGGGPSAAKGGNHGHAHERGKMLIADAGKYHALLTAHLATEGNELDIFFETTDAESPQPVAIPVESFTAQATSGEGEPKELTFACAPAEERPQGEKPGTCSHFVAKAPWMKPTDTLLVVAKLKLDGKAVTIRWKNFNPKKYAHHEE